MFGDNPCNRLLYYEDKYFSLEIIYDEKMLFQIIMLSLRKNEVSCYNSIKMKPAFYQLNLNSSIKTKYGTDSWKMHIKCQEHKSKNLCRKEPEKQ